MFKSIIVKWFGWFLMIQLLSRHACSLKGRCVPSVLLFIKGVRYCDAGNGVTWLLSFNHLSIINPLGTVYGVILSLTTEVTCISVFPGFWKNFPMILGQELPMTSTVAHIDSVHVGNCSYSQAMIPTRSCRV